jgi:hypothetical protein
MIPQNLEERNKWFNSLDKQVQRVVIAQDVIDQVKLDKYLAQASVYFKVPIKLKEDQPLQEVVEDNACTVCAIGAVFASRVRLGNDVKLDNSIKALLRADTYTSLASIENHITSIFDEYTLRLMEVAFEGYDAAGYFMKKYSKWDSEDQEEYICNDDYDAAVEFYGYRDTYPELLIDIMQNIIDNDGDFVL